MDAARMIGGMAKRAGFLRMTSRVAIRSAAAAAMDLLFPPTCSLCGSELEGARGDELFLCHACRALFAGVGRPVCGRCASPLPEHWPANQACPHCYQRKFWFNRAIALGEYQGGVRRAVVNMKRADFEPLMRSLGLLLGQAVTRRMLERPVQIVVPVPMHWWRRFRRGTNTARMLATSAAGVLELPIVTNMLLSRRRTGKQGTLLPHERTRNVRDAFRVSAGYDITDTEILLVDDVMTTGATLNEAARVLRRAGAGSITVAVVARGVGQQ